MFKFIGNLFAKFSIASIIRNIKLDVDTVARSGGYFLRIRVEAFDFKLLDEYVPLADGDQAKQDIRTSGLRLDEPVDIVRANQIPTSTNILHEVKARDNQ